MLPKDDWNVHTVRGLAKRPRPMQGQQALRLKRDSGPQARTRTPAMKSVLIVKLAALGDIAVGSATARAIRVGNPSARITWLTGKRGAELVELFADVDDIIRVDDVALFQGRWSERTSALMQAWKQLVGRRFDRVLLMHADRRYRILTLPVRAGRIDAFAHGAIPLLDRDRAAEYVRLFDPAATGDMQLADVTGHLGRSSRDPTQKTVVLVPGGARNVLRDDAVRRWPLENYRRLSEHLINAGFKVVILGDGNDRYVVPHFSGTSVIDRVGQLTLRETLQTIRDADLLITHDTGPLHFARLVGTPAVGLFGPTDPRHVVGSAKGILPLWGGETLPCRPCYDGRDFPTCPINVACMRDITVDRVVLAARDKLSVSQPGPADGLSAMR